MVEGPHTFKAARSRQNRNTVHRASLRVLWVGAVLVLLVLVSEAAVAKAQSSECAGGTLQVSAVVQSSIHLAAQIANGSVSIGGGNQEAAVSIPIDIQEVTPGGDDVAKGIPLMAIVSAANLPGSSRYRLEAVWSGCKGYTLKIDGGAVLPGTTREITSNKSLGDPDGVEIEHRMALYRAANSSSTCRPMLILTARPKK